MIALVLGTCPLVAVPNVESFENGVPGFLSSGKGVTLSVSRKHRIHGNHSLRIIWDGSGGHVRINRVLDARNKTINQRLYAAVFNLWIYQNDGKNAETLRFSFGRKVHQEPDCWFDYSLGFSGWRTIMMPFNRMAGKEQASMDWIQIHTPVGSPGEAYIDLLYPDVQFDRRHPMHDASFRFFRDDKHSRVRPGNPRHLYHPGIREVPDISITDKQRKALEALEKKLETRLLTGVTKSDMDQLRVKYREYQLPSQPDLTKLSTDTISGRHVFFKHTADIYEKSSIAGEIKIELDYDLKNASSFLLQLAKAWHVSTGKERDELETMIVSMNLLFLKSGWHEGHGQGTLHHFGYSSRSYYAASFLTRNLLGKYSLRRRVARAAQWFNYSHYCYDPYAVTHYANLDYFNTMAKEQLMALLMTDASGQRYHAVKQWVTMFSAAIANNRHGNNGGFKEDGSAYHHWGHYPAYEAGAVKAIGPIFYLLSDTPFRLSEAAYNSFRRALLALRIQCNHYSWPRSLSGRHPFRFKDNLGELQEAYVNFAMSGTPGGNQKTDVEMAAVALRLYPDCRDQFTPDIKPEPHPNGHWSFPYAHVSAHRRSNWLALARGLGRYVWGSEIYGPVNQYGRYQSHGTLEILPPGGLVGSGVHDHGWDWSRPPGATVTRLPLDRLSFDSIIMMPTTDETYVGNCHMDHQDGLFAMVLKEKKEPTRPNIGLCAHKSYHFFDDTIVCLGSSISNPQSKFPVETVLFQQHLKNTTQPVIINDVEVTTFPYHKKSVAGAFMRDVMGNYYHIPNGQNFHLSRQSQQSYYHYAEIDGKQGDSKNRDGRNAATEADYAVAWLDHGTRTKGASYHYAVLVLPDEKRVAAWKKSPGYQILRHDRSAHVVKSGKTTSYALFQAGNMNNFPIVHASEPCLVMTKEEGGNLKLNLTDPDLRMPGNEGGMLAGEIFVKPGNGPEVSSVRITLDGGYALVRGEGIVLQHRNGQTILTFKTLRGRSIPCVLKKK